MSHECLEPGNLGTAQKGGSRVRRGNGFEGSGDGLLSARYLSRVDRDREIRSRKQRTDIGKYSFASRTMQLWKQRYL
jgi:hypothetical protein